MHAHVCSTLCTCLHTFSFHLLQRLHFGTKLLSSWHLSVGTLEALPFLRELLNGGIILSTVHVYTCTCKDGLQTTYVVAHVNKADEVMIEKCSIWYYGEIVEDYSGTPLIWTPFGTEVSVFISEVA